jgi:ADP-ribosylglycohydrolase
VIGAIAGDIVGSRFEGFPTKSTEFELFGPRCVFTDDTVLTLAVAHAILRKEPYAAAMRRFARRYPNAGYGTNFYEWMKNERMGAYHSWGNGSAMRVSPVGFAYDSVDAVLAEAEKTAVVTHDHPEGVKGAQAVALAIYLARHGASKDEMRREIAGRFAYDLERTLAQIRPHYVFDVSCQGSVPESIIAFLESSDVESAIRNAVSLGGDSDTMGCIAGGIAQAFYCGVPPELDVAVRGYLPPELIEVLDEFSAAFS